MILLQCRTGMELRQLRYLVLLAEELSFTRAAARARVAQPALSRQIRNLEDELGAALVDRTSRRVRITPAGESLVERAIRVLQELEEARAEIIESKRVVRGRVSLGVTQTPGPLDVARLLRVFHGRYEDVELRVREDLSVLIAEQLRADEIDLGLISGIPDRARRGLTMDSIAREPIVVIVPPSREPGHGTIRLSDLQDQHLVLFPAPATIRSVVDALVNEAGVATHASFETTHVERMRELVAAGLGIGFLPLSDASRPGARVSTAVIDGYPLHYELFLARRARRRHAPPVMAMIDLITAGGLGSARSAH
jgi:LysR family transcriptional activator of glutamate synthase operon